MQASNIINGRAYTDKDTKLFTDLPKDIQYALTKWIYHNIASRKTVNLKYTSYDLKGLAEAAIGFYITNNEFKDAMLHCGFNPVNPNSLNWHYKINVKSRG